MLAFTCRYRRLIALLAIALQGASVVVGGLGHSHEGPADCCSVALCHSQPTHHHHHGTCSHNHEQAPPAPPADEPAENSPLPGAPHDDCSLCRHFSQPASPVTLIVEVPTSEPDETLVPGLLLEIVAAPNPEHSARGPPALCA